MATFISTIKFTQKGAEAAAETTRRAAAFTQAAEKMGAKVSKIYWTLGTFDGVIIFDAPDDETATAVMLAQASKGNVHTSTVRAFEAAEMEKIVGKLGK
jgi:uncharacterized protein with GYD domain